MGFRRKEIIELGAGEILEDLKGVGDTISLFELSLYKPLLLSSPRN